MSDDPGWTRYQARRLPFGMFRYLAEYLLERKSGIYPPLTDDEQKHLERIAANPKQYDHHFLTSFDRRVPGEEWHVLAHYHTVDEERVHQTIMEVIEVIEAVPDNICLAALADIIAQLCESADHADDGKLKDELLNAVFERAWMEAHIVFVRKPPPDKPESDEVK